VQLVLLQGTAVLDIGDRIASLLVLDTPTGDALGSCITTDNPDVLSQADDSSAQTMFLHTTAAQGFRWRQDFSCPIASSRKPLLDDTMPDDTQIQRVEAQVALVASGKLPPTIQECKWWLVESLILLLEPQPATDRASIQEHARWRRRLSKPVLIQHRKTLMAEAQRQHSHLLR
jgi:hypothetical protein